MTDESDQYIFVTYISSVFVGEKAPVALGDYAIGTNHVLPTDQTAKFGQGYLESSNVTKFGYNNYFLNLHVTLFMIWKHI